MYPPGRPLQMDYTGRYEDPTQRRPPWHGQYEGPQNSPVAPWKYDVTVENRYSSLQDYESEHEGEYIIGMAMDLYKTILGHLKHY